MSEQEIVSLLGKKHISDIQSEIYKHDLRHVLNGSDVVRSIQLLYKMGFKVCKNDK